MTPDSRQARRRAAIGLALACCLALAAPAAAQSTEFALDDGELVETRAAEPGSDEALMSQCRALLAEGKPAKAKKLLSPWIEQHKRSDNPWLAEAYLLRGDAKLALDREYDALFDYEAVTKNFPASAQYPEAVEREFGIAVRYVNGLRRRFLGMRIETGRPLGEELLIRTQERLPGTKLAERAAIALADHYYTRREMSLAGEMYAIFLTNYPDSEHSHKAALRQIECNIARFKGPRYDASGLVEAQLLIEDYRRRYPLAAQQSGIASSLTNWIDESQALQRLETARWYLRTGDEPSARLVLRRLLRAHPDSAAAATALDIMTSRGWVAPEQGPAPQGPPAADQADPGAG